MSIGQKLAIGYYRTKFKLLSAISKKKAAELAFELFCTPQLRHKKLLPKIFNKAEKLELEINGEKIKGYRFVVTNGLGHRRIYRDNKVSKEIIDFL